MAEPDVATLGPRTRFDPEVEARLVTLGTIVRFSVAVYAALVAVDRMFDVPGGPFLDVPFTTRRIPPVASLGMFVLTLGAVLAIDTRKTSQNSSARRMVGRWLSVAAMIGGAVLSAFALGVSLGVATLTPLDLPALGTGLSMMTLGGAVLLSVDRRESPVIAGQLLAMLVFSITAVVLAEFSLGDPALGSFLTGPEISLHAAVIAFVASIGVFLIRPGSGLLSMASSPGPGGRLLRRYGLLVLLAPAFLIWLAEAVSPADRIDALALVAVMLGLFLLVLLAAMVRTVDRATAEASTATAMAERAHAGLRQVAPVMADIAQDLHVIRFDATDQWDIATRYRPAAGVVAGDASLVAEIPSGEICVVMVDVTGHGAGPALDAIKLRDRLAHSIALGHTPAQALASVGWNPPRDHLATAIVARVETRSATVTLASAGQPPVILVTSQWTELIPPTGPLLFGGAGTHYENRSLFLDAGDSLVFFSDGVADVQRERNGRTEPQVLADLLLAEGGDAARGAELVAGFAEAEPSDDQTVLVIRRAK